MAAGRLRCKFVVNSVKRLIGADGEPQNEEIEAHAVYGQNGSENAQWSKYTPNGRLTMTITNTDAFGHLPLGSEVFIDITPVELLATA